MTPETRSADGPSCAQAPTPWVAIQRNPMSGSGKQCAELLTLIRHLRQHGLRPRLYSDRAELDAAIRPPHRRAALKAIVSAGGDGTLLDLLNRHPDLPIAVFPLGTENLVAKYLRLPRCGRTIARMIAAGRVETFDTATLNGRRFLIMASLGFDAAVLHRTHAARSGHISHWAYAVPILRELAGYAPPALRISVDDGPEVEGHFVIVGNLPRYALDLPLVPRANGHDGVLDIRIFRGGTRADLLRQLATILFDPAGTSEHVIEAHGQRVRSRPTARLRFQTDGDPAGTTPCAIEIQPAAVRLVVPESYRATGIAEEPLAQRTQFFGNPSSGEPLSGFHIATASICRARATSLSVIEWTRCVWIFTTTCA